MLRHIVPGPLDLQIDLYSLALSLPFSIYGFVDNVSRAVSCLRNAGASTLGIEEDLLEVSLRDCVLSHGMLLR